MAKPIQLLIDGYNLLFQSGLMGRGRGPGWLEKARNRLVNWLRQKLEPAQLEGTTIVFDAAGASPLSGWPDDEWSMVDRENSPVVLFARKHEQADDLIEDLIRTHPHAKTLSVVSSDHRIQRCAKSRGAKSIDSEDFVQQLESNARNDEQTGKSTRDSQRDRLPDASEVDYWLDQFDVED